MGWTYALHLCQRVVEGLCEEGGLEATSRVQDGRDSVRMSDGLMPSLRFRSEKLERVLCVMKARGLVLHKEEVSDEKLEVLAKHQPNAQEDVAHHQGDRLCGETRKDMERLIGHINFVSLCRREILAVLHSSYRFIRSFCGNKKERILWPSVAEGLMAWGNLCPLLMRPTLATLMELTLATSRGLRMRCYFCVQSF
eukprot:522181-Amphidinium_carterae.1